MSMRKLTSIVPSLAVLGFVLGACGQAGSESEVEITSGSCRPDDPETTVEITTISNRGTEVREDTRSCQAESVFQQDPGSGGGGGGCSCGTCAPGTWCQISVGGVCCACCGAGCIGC
jgi:hypothetical protein